MYVCHNLVIMIRVYVEIKCAFTFIGSCYWLCSSSLGGGRGGTIGNQCRLWHSTKIDIEIEIEIETQVVLVVTTCKIQYCKQNSAYKKYTIYTCTHIHTHTHSWSPPFFLKGVACIYMLFFYICMLCNMGIVNLRVTFFGKWKGIKSSCFQVVDHAQVRGVAGGIINS